MHRPRLKPFLTWSRLADEVLTVQGGGVGLYLTGEQVAPLAELLARLDGRPLADAARGVSIGEKEALDLVEMLTERGVLEDAGDDASGPDDALARSLAPYTARPRAAAARLRRGSVSVVGAGVSARAVRHVLAETGVTVRDGGGRDATFLIRTADAPVASFPPTDPIPSLSIELDGPVAWIGPTVLAGHACRACLAERRRGQYPRTDAFDARLDALARSPPAPAAPVPTMYEAASIAAREAMLFLSGARPPLLLDAAAEIRPEGAVRVHPVLPVPGCPGCGGPRP